MSSAVHQFFLSTKVQILFIIITPLFLYIPSINFEFIGLDDAVLITENQPFLQDISNSWKAFQNDVFFVKNTKGSESYYRPILTLSFILDAQFGRADPEMYHFTNVMLHILACVLLYLFLKALHVKSETSFILALAFSVHPILNQAIGWIPGRNDVLLTIFVLSSMIMFFLSLETFYTFYTFLHLLFFLLALFTKELAIFLPFFSFYYFAFMFKGSRTWKKGLFHVFGYFAVICTWLLLRSIAIPEKKGDLAIVAAYSKNFLENFPLLFQCIEKTFVPLHLFTFSSPRDTNYLLGSAGILLLILGLSFSRKKNWFNVSFGCLWFLAFLLPYFLSPELTGIGHRIYLPFVGLLIVFSQIDFIKQFRFNKKASILAIVVLAFLIANNVKLTSSFKNRLQFWEAAVEASPHYSLAYLNYGAALEMEGLYEKSATIYRQGISINPKEPMIHNNLGLVYARMKMFPEAEMEFFKEIEVNPNYSPSYYNLGLLYELTGLIPKAIRMWQKALSINPHHEASKRELAKYNH